jgi:hypothetical protein
MSMPYLPAELPRVIPGRDDAPWWEALCRHELTVQRVFSYTIIHHPVHPALAESVPYNVILVELPDAGSVRLISNLVDVPPDEVRVGLEVEVVFEDVGHDVTLPRFSRRR